VLAYNSFYYHAQLGADSFPYCPIDRCVFADGIDQFTCNGFEGVIAEFLHCAVVDFERIIEGDFVFSEVKFFAALLRFSHLFDNLDEFGRNFDI
jgi:hypothetical protein